MQPVNQIYPCMWFAGQACNLQPIDSIFALNKTTNGKFVIENLKNPTKMKIPSIIIIASVIISCNKLNIEKGTPACVENKIKKFNKSLICKNAKVDQYSFQGKTVYTFDPGNCGADMTTEVISSDCISLGYLGGITGNTKVNGEEFSTAKFIKTTWKK